jgi:hypothetical protein
MAKCQGLLAPCLPVTSRHEKLLFTKLATRTGDNFELMSQQWAAQVDGSNIFPKHRAHLRKHFKKWDFNRKLKAAITIESSNSDQLAAMLQANEAAAVATMSSPCMPSQILAPANQNSAIMVLDVVVEPLGPNQEALPMIDCSPVLVPSFLLGSGVSGVSQLRTKRKNGDRGKDGENKKRKIRACALCTKYGTRNQVSNCKVFNPRTCRAKCVYFKEDGSLKPRRR